MLEKIQALYIHTFNIQKNDLRQRCKKYEKMKFRHVYRAALYYYTDLSLSQIGYLSGSVGHSTVLFSIPKIFFDPELKKMFSQFENTTKEFGIKQITMPGLRRNGEKW